MKKKEIRICVPFLKQLKKKTKNKNYNKWLILLKNNDVLCLLFKFSYQLQIRSASNWTIANDITR